MKAWQHFCTITNHKMLVMKGCFKVGLYKQGLLHDLSKYGWTEFRVGAKYYQGTRSPNNAEREDTGCSTAWLHHKGRNKHHFEYWQDYSIDGRSGLVGMRMPEKYVVEMFIDRVSASKNYLREQYDQGHPLRYYEKGKIKGMLHEDTRKLLELLLQMLAEKGEKETFAYIRKEILRNKK